MSNIIEICECNREMICPYCGKQIHVGDSVGIVNEKAITDTKYSLFFFGVKQTDTVRNYSVYGCCDCCKKRNLFDTIVAWVFGGITFLWLALCLYSRIPMVVAMILLLIIWSVIGLVTVLIKWLFKIKKVSYQHARECCSLV
jgi:hypothetical protein